MGQTIYFLPYGHSDKVEYFANSLFFDWDKNEVTVKGEKAISEIAEYLTDNKLDLCFDNILKAIKDLGVVSTCEFCGEIYEYDNCCHCQDYPEPPEFSYDDLHYNLGDL